MRKVVAEEQTRWPSTITSGFLYDESEMIHRNLMVLEAGIIIAVILVMIIIVLSLGIRQGSYSKLLAVYLHAARVTL